MSAVSANPDPYYLYLGIPREEQPADDYRLLDIQRFESDPKVIEMGFERRMIYLSEIKSGDHLEDVEGIQNELARARLRLLNPVKKSAYDRELGGVANAGKLSSLSAVSGHDSEEESRVDAHYLFLGIPVEQQPADYYRLLDVQRFESNPEIIERGFDRRMAFLNTIRSADHLDVANNIKAELVHARLCLLSSATKSNYDLALQVDLAEQKTKNRQGNSEAVVVPNRMPPVKSRPKESIKTTNGEGVDAERHQEIDSQSTATQTDKLNTRTASTVEPPPVQVEPEEWGTSEPESDVENLLLRRAIPVIVIFSLVLAIASVGIPLLRLVSVPFVTVFSVWWWLLLITSPEGLKRKELRLLLNSQRRALSQAKSKRFDLRGKWKSQQRTQASQVQTFDSHLQQLKVNMAREIEQIRSDSASIQLSEYLGQCRLADANIKGIGPAKLHDLHSYGITTALNLNYSSIVAVPGFGDALAKRLLAWRDHLLQQFRFDPNRCQQQLLSTKQRFALAEQSLVAKIDAGSKQLDEITRRAEGELGLADKGIEYWEQEVAEARETLRLVRYKWIP